MDDNQLNELGKELLSKGKYKKAIKIFSKIKSEDFLYKRYVNTGICYKELKQYKKAIKYYEKSIKAKPDWEGAYNNLGNLYSDIKKYDKAFECYNKALELKPDFAEVYYNLAMRYSGLKQYDKAFECYNKALELKPGFAEAYDSLGSLYSNLKHYDKAIEHYEKAIELSEELDLSILDNLVSLYYKKLNNPDKALEVLIKHIDDILNPGLDKEELYPSDCTIVIENPKGKRKKNKKLQGELLNLIAEIYFDKKDYENSIKYFKLNLGYKSGEVYGRAGECYLESNQFFNAFKYFIVAYFLKPYNLFYLMYIILILLAFIAFTIVYIFIHLRFIIICLYEIILFWFLTILELILLLIGMNKLAQRVRICSKKQNRRLRRNG